MTRLLLIFLLCSIFLDSSAFKILSPANMWRATKTVISPVVAASLVFQGYHSSYNANTGSSMQYPLVAVAADVQSIFEGNYNDPNHPGCLRKINVKNGIVTIIGSDNIDGSQQWVIKAKEDAPGVMFVDFSPKGGPTDLLGVFNEKNDGIKWPDGNMWTKLKSK